MTDQEINRKLALAIGWEPEQIKPNGSSIFVRHCALWCMFNYRHWHTIGPIAQRYDCFPMQTLDKEWFSYINGGRSSDCVDTPQKAIALAVIATHGAGVLK